MKTLILFVSLIALTATASFAQCDKKVKFTSSKTEYVDSGGNLIRTEFEESVVKISKSEVAITVYGESKGTFAVKSTTCDWKVPFKEGKMTILGSMGEMNISFTLEGKNGKLVANFVVEGREDNTIRVTADKFEEDI